MLKWEAVHAAEEANVRILYIDPDDQSRKLHTIYLENILPDVEIVEKITVIQAIEVLQKDVQFDLIISEYETKQGKIANIFDFLKNHHPTIPLILFSEIIPEMDPELKGFSKVNFRNTNILKPIPPAEFREIILKTVQPGRVLSNSTPAFHKIRAIYFWRFNKVLCDVFTKKSDRQYVKVMNKNQKYTKQELEGILQAEDEWFFIRNEDFEKFSVGFTRTPFLEFDAENMQEADLQDSFKITHAIIHEMVQKLGISREVTELAEKNVSEILQVANSSEELKEVISKARSAKDYIYDHSYLLSIFSCNVCNILSMGPEQMKKLVKASIFHDITLDDPQIAMASHVDELYSSNIPNIEIEMYKGHPEAAANILKSSPLYDEDVDHILRQHHIDLMNQTEIDPQTQSDLSKLSNLACIFLLLHEYVAQLYKTDFEQKKQKDIIKKLNKKFNFPQFHNAISALTTQIFSN